MVVPVKSGYEKRIQPYLELVAGLARQGYSNSQIARYFKIPESTFGAWAADKEDLILALERGRVFTDCDVEVNGLLKRALGYNYVEVTKERKMVTDEEGYGEYKLVTTKKVYKHVMPDVNAAIYWLERRMAERWPHTPSQNMDNPDFNDQIQNVAELMMNPVKVRRPL